MATSESATATALHPLALINISDYYTRSLAQSSDPTTVVGLLLGHLSGHDSTIETSFELAWNDGIDREFFHTRLAQYKEVLPNLEAVGWYALGKQPTSQHIAIHTELSQLMESPLLLLFDPQGLDEDAGRVQKTLPVTVYESVEPTTSETGAAQLREVKWMLATSETERIAVDHVGKTGQASTRNMLQEVIVRYANDEIGAAALGQSSLESAGTEEEDSADLRDAALVAHHKQQINAVQILQARIELILRFVASVQSGTIATTPETQALVARVGVLVDALSSIQAQGSSAGATQAGNSQLDADRQATTQLDQLLTLLTSTRQLTTLIEDFGNAQRDDKASKRRQPQERREFRRAPGHGYPVEIGPGA